MKHLFFSLLFVALCETHAFAQSNICYSPSRQEAMKEFKSKQFQKAKNIFIAMKSCPDRPEKNDLDFWIKKCSQALSPRTQQNVISFAERMAKYEEHGTLGFNEGMMAVQLKSDWSKYEKRPEGSNEIDWSPKVGFVNESGMLVIACQYEDPDYYAMTPGYYFSDGLAAVIKRFPLGEKPWVMPYESQDHYSFGWGYIDKKGNTIIPFNYVNAHPFSEGLAAVVDNDDWKWTFIDKKGNHIFSQTFEWAGMFREGMCAVQPDTMELYGFIDKQGKMVIPAKYTQVRNFENGTAAVFSSEHPYEAALLDKHGMMVGDYTFRPEYLTLSEMYFFIVDCYNNKQYEKCYMGLEARKKYCIKEKIENDIFHFDLPFIEGQLYYYGLGGCPKDYNKAYSIYKKGSSSNCLFMQATCNELGLGTEKDHAKALDLYLNAIKADNFQSGGYLEISRQDVKDNGVVNSGLTKGYAYFNIGRLYIIDEGIPVSYSKALEFLKKAKQEGFTNLDSIIKACEGGIQNENES